MFKGSMTALITPFKDGQVDLDTMAALVERQIEGGTDVLVPTGTTGEASTLSYEEQLAVIEITVKTAKGRAKVMAGTGANCTREAISMTSAAAKLGVDGTLQVSPYYVKPSDEGIYRHFAAIADAVDLPMVLYSVPGRTGKAISVATVARLSKLSQVVAIKEAGGSVARVTDTALASDIDIISGDDGLAIPMISVGACGLISVVSNLLPADVKSMVDLAISGEYQKALEMHNKLVPLVSELFKENNPTGIKTAMAMAGLCPFEVRLPLCELQHDSENTLRTAMQTYGVI